MDIEAENQIFTFAEKITGRMLLDIEDPDDLMILDDDGSPIPLDKMSPDQKKKFKKALKEMQYRTLYVLLLSPEMTFDDFMELRAKSLQTFLAELSPVLTGE